MLRGISWETRQLLLLCAACNTRKKNCRKSVERNFSGNVLKNKTFNCWWLCFTCVNTFEIFADANFCKYSFMLSHNKAHHIEASWGSWDVFNISYVNLTHLQAAECLCDIKCHLRALCQVEKTFTVKSIGCSTTWFYTINPRCSAAYSIYTIICRLAHSH